MSLLLAGVQQDIRARNNLWARQGGCVDGRREWSSVTLLWDAASLEIQGQQHMVMRKKYANEKPVDVFISNQMRTYLNVPEVPEDSLVVKRSWNGKFEWCITEMWFIVLVTHHSFVFCLKESDQPRTSFAMQIRKLLKETLSILQDEGQIFRKIRTQDEVYNVCAHTFRHFLVSMRESSSG